METKKWLLSILFFIPSFYMFGQFGSSNLNRRIIQSDLVVEGIVKKSSSYFDKTLNEIFTVHEIEVCKLFKGDETIEKLFIVTLGGIVGDTTRYVFHTPILDEGDVGLFLLNQSELNSDFLSKKSIKPYEILPKQGFLKYQIRDKNYVVITPHESYLNLEKNLYQEIEFEVGTKRKIKRSNPLEKKFEEWFEEWFEKQLVDKPENFSVETIVEYTIENSSLTGAFNEYLEFDLNIQSLLTNEEFYSGDLLIEYNNLTFGSNLVSSGKVTLTKGTVILSPNYNLAITDIAPNKLQIEIQSSSNNPNALYLVGSQSEDLVHVKIDISNLLGNTGISFDELQMQGLSEFFDISQNAVKSFDLVKADENLDIDINSFSSPTITDFYPKTVKGGVDTITIIGTGFGTNQNLGYVEFTDAQQGNNPVVWIRPHSSEYYDWSDTLIRVKVTSLGSLGNGVHTFGNHAAGTGKIRITPDGGNPEESDSTLFVIFSTFNILTGGKTVPVVLIDANGQGSYTLNYDSSFINYSGAVDAFERAVKTWRCSTGLNLIVNDSLPNNSPTNELEVSFGSIGSVAQAGMWIFNDCTNSSHSYLTKFTIKFNDFLIFHADTTTPSLGSFEYDLETVALHELGHIQLLHHSNDYLNVMWWETQDSIPYVRDLSNADFLGGQYIMNLSSNNPTLMGICPDPMKKVPIDDCGFINSNQEILKPIWNFTVYPNPITEIINLEVWADNIDDLQWKIFDIQGRLVLEDRLRSKSTSISTSLLPTGVYVIVLQSKNHFITTKLIKL